MKRQHGFTLIEMIAALAILAALATLITVAASTAIKYMKGVSAANDVDQVVKALEIYKQKYGEYPPDGTDQEAVERHIKKRWVGTVGQKMMENGTVANDPAVNQPLNVPETTTPMTAAEYLSVLSPLATNVFYSQFDDPPETLTADRSLSFWLCGLGTKRIDSSGAIPTGSVPQTEIFMTILGNSNNKLPESATPILELKNGENYVENLNETTNWQDGWLTDSDGVKFVYFRARKGGYTDVPAITVDGATIAPLAKDGKWYADDTYQLWFAGEDGTLGTDDDLTNFSNGKTVGDLKNE